MRNFIFTTNIVVLALLSTLFGCTENKIEQEQLTPTESVITLGSTTMEVAAAEGEYSIDYTIENRTEQLLPTLHCEAKWIVELEATHTSIHFGVAANNADAREAIISVSYNNSPSTISVKQAAYDNSQPFYITIETLSSTSCTTRIDATDAEMDYIMYLSSTSYFIESNIQTAEELFEDDKSAFLRGAMYDGIPVEQYLKNYNTVFTGTTRTEWSDLTPGSKNVLYVYGVEFTEDGSDYEPVTDIVYEIIIPTPAPLHEEVSFDATIEVSGPEVTFNVTPKNWDGYYMTSVYSQTDPLYIAPGTSVDEEYTSQVATSWIDTCNWYKMYSYYTDQDILDNVCIIGPITETVELTASTSYCAAIYAIEMADGVLQLVSKPIVKHFTTESVAMSDMTLDINVENAYSRVADITITPSNNEEQYLFVSMPSEYITQTDEADILNELTTTFLQYAYKFTGEMSIHIATLEPTTEYSAFVFGYYGGVVTTPLYREDFTTTEAAPGTVQVEEVIIGGPYNPGELAAALPEMFSDYAQYADMAYIITMQTITDKPTIDKYHLAWDVDTFNYFSTYYPDIVLSDLIGFYCEEVGYEICSFNVNYLVCGIAMDEKGNLGDMWSSETFCYTADDYVPVDDAVEAFKQNGAKRSNVTLATRKSLVINE